MEICTLRQRREQIVGVGTKREGAKRSFSVLIIGPGKMPSSNGRASLFLWTGGEEGRRAFYANLEDYVRELKPKRDSLPRARCARSLPQV